LVLQNIVRKSRPRIAQISKWIFNYNKEQDQAKLLAETFWSPECGRGSSNLAGSSSSNSNNTNIIAGKAGTSSSTRKRIKKTTEEDQQFGEDA
jgi:hypothetical protein